MKNKPFTYEKFKAIYSKVPRLCVDAVIRTKDGIVLSLRKGGYGWDNQWHLPGGTVLYKEKIEDALHRLVKNEIGIDVKIIKLLGYIEFESEEKERGWGYSVSIAMLCDYMGGEFSVNENTAEVKVFSEVPENVVKEHGLFLKEKWGDILNNEP